MSPSLALPYLAAQTDGHRGDQQALRQGIDPEAVVRAMGDGAQVAFGILAEVDGMVNASGACLNITEDAIHPVEVRQILRFAITYDDGQVLAVGLPNSNETSQTIGADATAGAGVRVAPGGNGL